MIEKIEYIETEIYQHGEYYITLETDKLNEEYNIYISKKFYNTKIYEIGLPIKQQTKEQVIEIIEWNIIKWINDYMEEIED